jgi:uncharacterized coiled-coil DUF342 family protein
MELAHEGARKGEHMNKANEIIEAVKKMRKEHNMPRATMQSVYWTFNEFGTKENWNHHNSIASLKDHLSHFNVTWWKMKWLPQGDKNIHIEFDYAKEC